MYNFSIKISETTPSLVLKESNGQSFMREKYYIQPLSSGRIRWWIFWAERQRGRRVLLTPGGRRKRWVGEGGSQVDKEWEFALNLTSSVNNQHRIQNLGVKWKSHSVKVTFEGVDRCYFLLFLSWTSGWCCCPSLWHHSASPEELLSQGWVTNIVSWFLLLFNQFTKSRIRHYYIFFLLQKKIWNVLLFTNCEI